MKNFGASDGKAPTLVIRPGAGAPDGGSGLTDEHAKVHAW